MTGILANAGLDPERDEKARRAVKAFRSMQPTLTAYARMVTKRRDVRVELATSATPATDNKRIYYRPPIEMGDNTPHQRALCDKRDENLQSLCPACLTREKVLVNIFHEIGHIAQGSFVEPSAAEVEAAFKSALAEVPKEYAAKVEERFKSASTRLKSDLFALTSLVNEYLPFLANALEDARVDREMFKARKGLKVMFDADVWRIFTKGVEGEDGEFHDWKDNAQNTQVMVGTYCKAAGYDVTGWFIPPVEEALSDQKLNDLLRRIDTVRSASGVYQLSFAVLARLRELGFCGTPNDPDPEPPMPEPSDEGDESEDGDSSKEEDSSDEGQSEQGPSSGEPGDEADSGEPEESEGNEGQAPSDDGEPEGQADPGDADEDQGQNRGDVDERDESERSSDREADGSETGEGEESSESSDDGDRSGDGDSSEPGDDSDSGEQAGDPEQADKADSDAGDGSPKEGDSSEPSDRPEPQGSSDEDSDGAEGEDRGSSSDEQADGEGDQGSGDTRKPAPTDGDASPSRECTEGDDEGTSSVDNPVDSDDNGEPGASSAGGGPDGEPEPGDDLETEQDAGTDSAADDRDDVETVPDPIDTGADKGMGGTEVIENEAWDDVPMGAPEDLEKAFHMLHADPEADAPKSVEESANEEAIDRAIVQGFYFETPSRNIYGVREHEYGIPQIVGGENMSSGWDPRSLLSTFGGYRVGKDGEFDPEERLLGPALLEMRNAFADNQRGRELRHRKGGKVDGRVLGKRAPLNDERLFKKKILPGKKNYFVLIGMDISGSTLGLNIVLEKKAVMAQAELLTRMGIDFAIYAHSGDYHDPFAGRAAGLDLDIYMIKKPEEPWTDKERERLVKLGPSAANLDGHTLEYYRKILDASNATDKIILYYTDGKMPAENHDEELEILQREIRTCKNKGYTLLGVGIRTDSPVRHGLDTVQVDEDADMIKVVQHLEKRLV